MAAFRKSSSALFFFRLSLKSQLARRIVKVDVEFERSVVSLMRRREIKFVVLL